MGRSDQEAVRSVVEERGNTRHVCYSGKTEFCSYQLQQIRVHRENFKKTASFFQCVLDPEIPKVTSQTGADRFRRTDMRYTEEYLYSLLIPQNH
jgi:hypothetical protein